MGDAMQTDHQQPEAGEQDSLSASMPDGIQRAIAGRYTLGIEEVLTEAWALIDGHKLKLNIAVAIYSAVAIVVALIVGGIQVLSGENVLVAIVGELVSAWITLPIAMGLFAISLDRASGGDVLNDRLFAFFPMATRLLLATILMTLLIFVGYVLLVLPGIYLSVAYLFALPLLVQERLGIVDALEASRKAITHRWFTVFGLLLVLTLVNGLAAIPLGIGLIWSVPLTVIAIGLAYKWIFLNDATE